LPIVKSGTKHDILNALISSNNDIWPKVQRHTLTINMRLAVASAAQIRGGILSQEEIEQLRYYNMLNCVSANEHCRDYCQIKAHIDDDTCTLGLPLMTYYTTKSEAVEWIYPNGNLDANATILCATNESVDEWNAIAQNLNTNDEHILKSRDSFSEVDDIHGNINKMLTPFLLNRFNKTGIPNHELILKVGDVCLITRAIKSLDIANNSRVKVVEIFSYSVKVVTIGEEVERTIRIPRIPFKFRLPYGESYQMTRLQFPLRLAYAMTYNKSQSQTLSKVLLDITTPPFAHGQAYVALSRVRDSNNIALFLSQEQLVPEVSTNTGFMPTFDNIAYQEVLHLNR
jgi:hypothetical protein